MLIADFKKRLLTSAMVIAGTAVLAQPALAQTPITPPNAGVSPGSAQEAAAANSGIQVLLDQANFWRERQRRDLEMQSLERIIEIDPNQPQAVARLAEIALEEQKPGQAQQYLNQLKQTAPNSQATKTLENRIRVGAIPQNVIAEARSAAQQGQTKRAIQLYQQAFQGSAPPPEYQLEYYQTLAGVDWQTGKNGLAQLARARPNDVKTQVAYGEVLTYQDATRKQGIAILEKYSQQDPKAMAAWKQAVGWLPENKESVAEYKDYLKANPQDQEIETRLKEVTKPAPVDPNAARLKNGYAALDKGQLKTAESNFSQVLKSRPNDASALGGMGIVKLRQKQFSSARSYLDRAMKVSPSQRSKWTSARSTADFFAKLQGAEAAQKKGDLKSAESLAKQAAATGYKDKALAENLLAGVYLEEGKAPEAEAQYRKILQSSPNSVEAKKGLIEALLAQREYAEANQLAAELPEGTQVEGLRSAQAEMERDRAKEMLAQGNPGGALLAYERAVAAAPTDPWIRLDLARLLAESGDVAQGFSIMNVLLQQQPVSEQALQAAAIYAQEYGSEQQAYALINQIPPDERSEGMNQFVEQLELRSVIQQADAAYADGNDAQAISLLRNLATRTDLPVGMRAQVAQKLYEYGDQTRAVAMAQDELTRGAKGDPAAYTGFVDVLAQAGQDASASAMIQQLAAQAQTPEDRRAVAELNATLIAKRADQLRLSGDYAQSFDLLSRGLALSPNNPQLLGALARLYQSGGMPEKAVEVYDVLLARNPTDPNIFSGAAVAAMSDGLYSRANDLIDRAIEMDPRNPRLYLTKGQIKQAQGDPGDAIEALETAQALQRERMGFYVPPAIQDPLQQQPAYGVPAGQQAPAGQQPPVYNQQPPPQPGGTLGPNPFRTSDASDGLSFRTSKLAGLATSRPAGKIEGAAGPARFLASSVPVRASTVSRSASSPEESIVVAQNTADTAYVSQAVRRAPTRAKAEPYRPALAFSPLAPEPQFPELPETPTYAQADLEEMEGGLPPATPPRAEVYDMRGSVAYSDPIYGAPANPAGTYTAEAPTTHYQNPSAVPSGYQSPAAQPLSQQPYQSAAAQQSPRAQSAGVYAPPAYEPQLHASFASTPARPPVQYPSAQPVQYAQMAQAQPVQFSPLPTTNQQDRSTTTGQAYDPTQYGTQPPQQGTIYTPYGTSQPNVYGGTAQPYTYGGTVQPNLYGTPPAQPQQPQQRQNAPTYIRPQDNQPSIYAQSPPVYLNQPSTLQVASLSPLAVPQQDTLSREIDETLRAVKREVAPRAYASVRYRNRSGESGLSALSEWSGELQGSFVPFGIGRMTLTAEPVSLDAGAVASNAQDRFGTNPLRAIPIAPPEQQQAGAAVNLAFEYEDVTVDVGSTPLGFEVNNIVGGAKWEPKLTDQIGIQLGLERRPVTDSVLSYAGTQNIEDQTNVSNKVWGGVVKTGGFGGASYDDGNIGVYGTGGFYNYEGQDVASNNSTEVNIGGYVRPIREPNRELQVGLNLNYTRYDNNLRYFTYGHGGYFSPQRFIAIAAPVKYAVKGEKWDYSIEAAPGFQSYSEDDADYFPNNADLQEELARDAAIDPDIQAVYQGRSESGLGFAARATTEYRLSEETSIGGAVDFNSFGDFTETSAKVYMRHVFGSW